MVKRTPGPSHVSEYMTDCEWEHAAYDFGRCGMSLFLREFLLQMKYNEIVVFKRLLCVGFFVFCGIK